MITLHPVCFKITLYGATLGSIISQWEINYTGLQGFVVEKLWVVSGVIFDAESGIRISLSRQNFQIFEVMCSKNGVFHYF